MLNEGMTITGRPPVGRGEWLTAFVLVSALIVTRLHSYLLFHTLAELFTMVVGLTVFTVAWNTRRHLDDPLLLGIGIVMAPLALTLALHSLAYKGMGVFSDRGANLATQLWIAGRLLLAVGVVAAATPWSIRVRPGWQLAVLLAFAGSLWLAIFSGVFPDCYVEGKGLTPFKVGGEYVAMAVMLVAAARITRDSLPRDPRVKRLIAGTLLLQFASSAAFTFYVDVYGALNLAGHVFAICSALAIYAAVAWEGLAKPQAIFYGQLSKAKDRFADEAGRATGEIDDFAYVLAHHLQEPVRLQYSYTQRLERLLPVPLSPDLAETLQFIKAGALRQRALLRDVQLYLSTGRTAVSQAPCNAATAAASALRQLNDRLQEARAVVETGDLPMVRMDRAGLVQVFLVLLDNALSYCRPDVPLRIRIDAEQSGGEAVFSITDNGQGIPTEFHERVFKVFDRGLAGGDTGAGTGIGLALARKLVEQALGRIWVETPPDQDGARIRFILPLAGRSMSGDWRPTDRLSSTPV